MSLPLVYLDQNVISRQSKGLIDLSRLDVCQWVFSTEHFNEISRSCNPAPYLDALDQLSAKRLELECVDWELTGKVRLLEYEPAVDGFQRYIDAGNDVDFSTELLAPIFSWLCGGASAEELRRFPSVFSNAIESLLADIPSDFSSGVADILEAESRHTVDSLLEAGNDISELREQLGFPKGSAGAIDGDNPLVLIWDVVRKRIPESITAEQFFGFASVVGQQNPPINWLGIIGCCAVLDIVGYKSEKKVREAEHVPNVMSDAVHIAYGAFCSGIVSNDPRFNARAKAIYKFLGLDIAVLRVVENSLSQKSAR